MANPQSENGHVDIAHEIVEALACYRIPGEAMQCLWVVFRKTYGWKKVEDEISLSQFSLMTGLSRSSAVRGIKWLVTKKILLCYKEVTTYANKYKFNKDFEQWMHGYKKDTTKKVTGVTKKLPEVVTIKQIVPVTLLSHTKETSTKETSKESTHTRFEEFWNSYPKRNGKKIGRDVTLAKFIILEPVEQDQVVVASQNYARSKLAREGFSVDPVRFFKSREYPSGLWREWLEPEVTNAGSQNGGSGRESAGDRRQRERNESDRIVRAKLGLSPRGVDVLGKKIIIQPQAGREGTMEQRAISCERPEAGETGE